MSRATVALTDAQIPLVPAIASIYRDGEKRILALAVEAMRANGLGADDLAHEAEIDPAQLSRALAGRGAHPPARFYAVLIAKDRQRVFLRGLCRLAGCELVEKPRLTPEEKLARLEATLRKHGAMGEALIAESYEDA